MTPKHAKWQITRRFIHYYKTFSCSEWSHLASGPFMKAFYKTTTFEWSQGWSSYTGLTVALLPSIDENWWILIMLYVLKCCYIQIFSFSKCCTCWCTAILRSNNLLKDRNQDRKQDRSSYWRCSVKRDILKISQVLQRNSYVGVSF